jgi:hypothetical protein
MAKGAGRGGRPLASSCPLAAAIMERRKIWKKDKWLKLLEHIQLRGTFLWANNYLKGYQHLPTCQLSNLATFIEL